MVVLLGVIPIFFGLTAMRDGSLAGIMFIGFGALLLYAGSMGVLYKIIADGVARGNKNTGNTSRERAEVVEKLDEISKKLDSIEKSIKKQEKD